MSLYTLAIQGAAQAAELLGLGDAVPPLGNVLISNVPGPRETLYLWGAALEASYPLSAIPPGLAMNITVFSYRDKFDVGTPEPESRVARATSMRPDLKIVAG